MSRTQPRGGTGHRPNQTQVRKELVPMKTGVQGPDEGNAQEGLSTQPPEKALLDERASVGRPFGAGKDSPPVGVRCGDSTLQEDGLL